MLMACFIIGIVLALLVFAGIICYCVYMIRHANAFKKSEWWMYVVTIGLVLAAIAAVVLLFIGGSQFS